MKDVHIHLMPMIGPADPPEVFLQKTALAGVDGGTIFSLPPVSFRPDSERSQHWRDRLEYILEYTLHTPGFQPFFWIDPTEPDAAEQIAVAAESGARGFKCICNHFVPSSQLDKFAMIAETGLPLQFHSGILFDHYESAQFNRPIAFECLIKVKNLRFSLAHIGWPWCDEYIAVYGKLRAAQNNVLHEQNLTMFIDLTPGTPVIYRREVLRKLYLTDYQLANRVLWGSDCRINDYNYEKVLKWQKIDREIMAEIEAESRQNPLFQPVSRLFEQATETNFQEFYRS